MSDGDARPEPRPLLDGRARDGATVAVSVVTERLDGDWEFDGSLRVTVMTPAQATAGQRPPDVYFVDASEQDALPIVMTLAQGGSQPVVVFGPTDSRDSMRYLDVGAADYVSPRTPPSERCARLRAASRRNSAARLASDTDVRIGTLAISLPRREVRRGGELLHLTPHEFELLELLLRNVDRIVPHRKLMAQVWGIENTTSRHYLRIYIRQLRQKLEDDPENPKLIITEWGRGYCLRTGSAERSAASA